MTNFEPDEFDRMADEHPVGVHRRPETRLRALLPFILVLIIVPVLAWLSVAIISGGFTPSTSRSDKAVTQQTPKKTTPPKKAKTTPTPTKTQEPEKVSEADKNRQKVVVLNVSAAQGAAGTTADYLKSNGYSSVEATNSQGNGIAGTSVYYADPADKAVAKDMAKALNISTVKEDASLLKQYKSTIAVFIFKDFTPPSN